MPCACRVPIPDYPSNAAWGPILWTLLHGIAEKAQAGLYPVEEARQWVRFIKQTGEILPCDQCREHYVRYSQTNPLTQFTDIPYTLLKTKVKTWFWQLHADIRAEYGKEVLPYDQLTATYGSVNLQDMFWRLEPVIKTAFQLKGMGMNKWVAWIKEFKMLRANLGV